jgi:prevent-host-death family protein
MKRMRASTFKVRCDAVIKEIQKSGEPVIVTSNGKPIVRIVPIESKPDDIFGSMVGKVKIVGDIESPVVPTNQWKVMKKRRPSSTRKYRSRFRK